MSPSEFRALLEKATARPWGYAKRGYLDNFDVTAGEKLITCGDSREEEEGSIGVEANAEAIVATMNRAELFAGLWDAAESLRYKLDLPTEHPLSEVLAKLDACP